MTDAAAVADHGAGYQPMLVAAAPATMGETLDVLPRGAPACWNAGASFRVRLYGGALTSKTDARVLEGANAAAIRNPSGAWEIVQFAGADLIDANTYRLSRLLRGQGGSEHAIVDALPAGAPFVVLDEHLLPRLAEQGTVRAVPMRGYWRDVGRPETYLQSHRDLLAGKVDVFDHEDRPVITKWEDRTAARVVRGAEVADSLLAPGCEVAGTVVRSVLGGKATGSYLGKVAVARDAQKTDASQSVKAMLLTRTATANAKPELEIFADDVKCAHGATVGELDAMALFYLESRGVGPAEARALLTRAFVADALARIGEERVRAAFEADADRWMGGGE